jgi:hypothetical protein
MLLLKTRFGRYLLGAVAIWIAIIIMNTSIISTSAPRPTTRAQRSHRPPVSAHYGEIIRLTVNFSAATPPSQITWSINNAVHPVDMRQMPPNTPQFSQIFTYDPSSQYDINATGRYPLNCTIHIDTVPVDNDFLPPASRGGNVNIGDVHCWVYPV